MAARDIECPNRPTDGSGKPAAAQARCLSPAEHHSGMFGRPIVRIRTVNGLVSTAQILAPPPELAGNVDTG